MMDFFVEKIEPAANLRALHGVLKIASLAVTSDAERAAEQILEEAQQQADLLLENAQEEAQSVIAEAEQQVLLRAEELLTELENTHAVFIERAQELVLDLTQGLFDRLVQEMTPRERLQASFKNILREAPPRLANALLRVHPDDMALLPETEWELKSDISLPRGTCRLEAHSGVWHASFDAAVASLKQSLSAAVHENAGSAEMDDADEYHEDDEYDEEQQDV